MAGSIADLVNRVARPAPAAVAVARASGESVLRVALAPDWSRSLIAIDQKLEDLTARRAGLLAERRDLLLDAIDGDGPAKAQVDKLDRALAALDIDLARVADARGVAAAKAAEDRAAAARRDHLTAVARFDSAVEALTAQAAALDRLTAEYARQVLALANASEAARRLCPGRLPLHPGDHMLGFDRTVTAIRRNLRAAGCAWAWSAEFPAPPTIAATIAEGAAWARTHPADNRFNPET
jgi:hypothetical protein